MQVTPDMQPNRRRRLTVVELAMAALDEAGNEAGAASILFDQVMDEPAYVREICALIIHRVAADTSHRRHAQSRARSTSTASHRHAPDVTAEAPKEPATRPGEAPKAARAMASVVGRTIFNFDLPGGVKLGEATSEIIIKAIGSYREQARTMTTRVRWLEKIAARIKPGETVADSMDELTARTLLEEAENVDDQ